MFFTALRDLVAIADCFVRLIGLVLRLSNEYTEYVGSWGL